MTTRFIFTKKALENYPRPEKRNIRIYDDKCRFLCLLITPAGRRTFCLYRFDKVKKRPVQKVIGTFPETTIALARDTANRWLVELTEQRLTGKKSIPTVEEAINAYIENRLSKLSPNTVDSYRSMLKCHLDDWKNLRLDSITRQDVVSKFLKLSRSSESVGNRVFRLIRAVFNEQMDLLNDDIGSKAVLGNPVSFLTRRKLWNKEVAANDWIVPEKLELAFSVLCSMRQYDEFYALVADYFEFLILTGLRRREASMLQIQSVNLKSLLYEIKPKGKESVLMPLTERLVELLDRRIEISKTIGSNYVFANLENGGKPLNDPRRAMKYFKTELNCRITLHGFRRSFATYAESIDLSQYVIKRLLNHSFGRDITAIHYIQRDMVRLREALEKVGNHIYSLARTSTARNKPLLAVVHSKNG